MPPVFTTDMFRGAFLRLLPTGPIWQRTEGSALYALATAWGATFARNAARSSNLLTDANPASTTELLPEWEETLGLPDPCAGESPTVERRRTQVVARIVDGGGSSVDYFVNFAKILGYQITIDQFAPARAGLLKTGDALNGESWAYAWRINYPGYSLSEFVAGSSAGDPLSSWGNAVLECEIKSRAPAHTVIIFAQSYNFVSDFGGDII